MANKYKKEKTKLGKNAIIIIAVSILVIVGVFVFTNLPNPKKQIMDVYPSLTTSEHVFEKISYSQFEKKMEAKEQFFVFYGKKDCEACQARVADVNATAASLKIKVVYYLDANSLSDEQKSELYNTYNVKKNFTPQLLSFNDGKKVLGTYEDMFGKTYVEADDTNTNFKTAIAHVLNAY